MKIINCSSDEEVQLLWVGKAEEGEKILAKFPLKSQSQYSIKEGYSDGLEKDEVICIVKDSSGCIYYLDKNGFTCKL